MIVKYKPSDPEAPALPSKTETLTKEGYLYKRTVTKMSPIATWSRRYFLLQENEFSYCMTSTSGKYRGVVMTTAAVPVVVVSVKRLEDEKKTEGRRFCFEVAAGKKSFVLQGKLSLSFFLSIRT